MGKVKEWFQGQHGFESQEECQWVLVPPTDVEGFVSGKIWATLAANESRNAHQHQNRGMGVTKAQYIDATMDCMENGGVFNTIYDK